MRRIPQLPPLSMTCLALVALAALVPAAGAQDEETAPKLTLEAIIVEPEAPAVDTLCKLRVKIRNDGEQTASQLGFTVKSNDVELPVYLNHLFMYPVEPGATAEIPLYNFWSTETSRPEPADGKLRLEVTLREAEWMSIEMEDDVEVWRPLGAVENLPSTLAVTLSMAGG